MKLHAKKLKTFRRLHQQPSTFVLPNAWDAMSAKMFEAGGFKAIGTTSAGIAASLGYPDGQHLPRAKMVDAVRNIANSVAIPVSADIEAGYGQSVAKIVQTVKAVAAAGAVGINIEDGTGDPSKPVFSISEQTEKIAAIKANHTSLFVNARTDIYWLNIGDPLSRFQEATKRAKAYQEAGADCLFIPGLTDRGEIQKMRAAISCPINLLVDPEMPSLTELSAIGIERLSCGSAPFRATATLLAAICEQIVNDQTFSHLTKDVLSYSSITKIMSQ
ncbi:isocitrate lyase/PEP mutase family protein [Shouchella tritolerans]|uniref:isocitrate lyase/PEP mutase family protein n=1 Tax=Shouchella tritolerans TaxID=2979466 RepID=UPI0021E8B333|nr:isocitrate lyase/phosphoenolpyruvate mutase family protein [Shouchella tritolerans]